MGTGVPLGVGLSRSSEVFEGESLGVLIRSLVMGYLHKGPKGMFVPLG